MGPNTCSQGIWKTRVSIFHDLLNEKQPHCFRSHETPRPYESGPPSLPPERPEKRGPWFFRVFVGDDVHYPVIQGIIINHYTPEN